MILRICTLFTLLAIISCGNSSTNNKNFSWESKKNNTMKDSIAYALENKYNEPFEVEETNFEIGLNVVVFKASPKANKAIKFEGQFDERKADIKKSISQDAYPNQKFSCQAGEYYESLFPNKQLKHIAKASVYTPYEHTYGTTVPEWKDYLKERPKGTTVGMNTYFFEVPNDAYDQSIVTLYGIMESLHETYENDYSVYAGFWPKGFLEDKKFDELTFGFEASSHTDADDILLKQQYLAKEVFIKIVNSSLDNLDENKLFELIKDYNKNGPTPVVEL